MTVSIRVQARMFLPDHQHDRFGLEQVVQLLGHLLALPPGQTVHDATQHTLLLPHTTGALGRSTGVDTCEPGYHEIPHRLDGPRVLLEHLVVQVCAIETTHAEEGLRGLTEGKRDELLVMKCEALLKQEL